MKTFVLVNDDQLPLSPKDAAESVSVHGVREAARRLGFSEQTLRRFLAKNGYGVTRTTGYTITQPQEGKHESDETRPADGADQLPRDTGGEGGVEGEGPDAA